MDWKTNLKIYIIKNPDLKQGSVSIFMRKRALCSIHLINKKIDEIQDLG